MIFTVISFLIIFYLKPYSYDAFIPLQVSPPSILSRKTQEVYVNWKLKVSKTKQSIENLHIFNWRYQASHTCHMDYQGSSWSNVCLKNKIPSFILTKVNFWSEVGPYLRCPLYLLQRKENFWTKVRSIWGIHCSYCIASHSQSSKL